MAHPPNSPPHSSVPLGREGGHRSPSVVSSVSSLLSTLKQSQTYDYLRASANTDLTKYLYACSRKDAPPSGATASTPTSSPSSSSPSSPSPTSPPTETIQFADTVLKINRKQKRQERVLIITNKALYNFQPNSYKVAKRRIPITDIKGIILSRCSDELIFQVSDSYDYRYEIKRRSEVLEMLSKAYEKCLPPPNNILLVSFSEERELKDMVITKDVLRTLQQVSVATALKNNAMNNGSGSGSDGSHGGSGHHSGGGQLVQLALDEPLIRPPSPSRDMYKPHAQRSASYSERAHTPVTGSASPGQAGIRHIGAAAVGARNISGGYPAATGIGAAACVTPPLPTVATPGHASPRHGRTLTNGENKLGLSTSSTNNKGTVFPSTGQQASKALLQPNIPISASTPVGPLLASLTDRKNGLLSPAVINAAAKAGANNSSSSSSSAYTYGSNNSSLHNESSLSFRDPTSRLEGWLTKQKGTSKRWDRKYFILTQKSMQYYMPRITGNVRLVPPITARREAGVRPTVCFESSTHMRGADSLILAFANDDDATTWSAAFLHRNLSNQTLLHTTIDDAKSAHHSPLTFHTHKEGWLLRKEKGEKWHRRYVVLTQDRAWFFEMALKGSVDFTNGVSAHSSNQIQSTEEPNTSIASNFAGRYALSRFAYRWNVSDSVRIFHLAADSEDDMQLWIDAIDLVNREHGGKGGLSTHASMLAAAKEEQAAAEALLAQEQNTIKLPDEFIEAVEQPAPEGVVTFVFTDVQNSTSLWEKVPDAMDIALEQHDRILRELLKKYNGYEVKTEGDAFMVTFFSVIDAVLWCLHVQLALVETEWSEEFCSMPSAKKEFVTVDGKQVMTFNGIRIRMGVHVGNPNARRNPVTGRMDYFGPPVNRTARVSDTGHGGQIVCTTEVCDVLQNYLKTSAMPQAITNPSAVTSTEGSTAASSSSSTSTTSPSTTAADDSPPRIIDSRLTSAMNPIVTDCGCHSLKGINEPVRLFQLMPQALAHRTLPPLRTSTNEKIAKDKATAAAAAAAALAATQPASPTRTGVNKPTASVSSTPSRATSRTTSIVAPTPTNAHAMMAAAPTPTSATGGGVAVAVGSAPATPAAGMAATPTSAVTSAASSARTSFAAGGGSTPPSSTSTLLTVGSSPQTGAGRTLSPAPILAVGEHPSIKISTSSPNLSATQSPIETIPVVRALEVTPTAASAASASASASNDSSNAAADSILATPTPNRSARNSVNGAAAAAASASPVVVDASSSPVTPATHPVLSPQSSVDGFSIVVSTASSPQTAPSSTSVPPSAPSSVPPSPPPVEDQPQSTRPASNSVPHAGSLRHDDLTMQSSSSDHAPPSSLALERFDTASPPPPPMGSPPMGNPTLQQSVSFTGPPPPSTDE